MHAGLRDRIVSRHCTRENYKINAAALKVSKSTVAYIILKWSKCETTRTLSAGCPA